MSPIVESALISAGATIVSVLATATVAIVGFRSSRSTNQRAIDAARANVRETLDATRDGQIADRYTKAIEQLGSSTVDVTIGGIYALERIARDSPRDHPTIMEVLSACIREHSREQWLRADADGTMHEQSPRPDIQAALTVIGRRNAEHDIRPIDLSNANLNNANLNNANLGGVDFVGANFVSAKLAGARLDNANLTRADLRLADLAEADLNGANLTSAQLDGARLTGARLTEANLTNAEWPMGTPVPARWKLDVSSQRLEWQGTDSRPT